MLDTCEGRVMICIHRKEGTALITVQDRAPVREGLYTSNGWWIDARGVIGMYPSILLRHSRFLRKPTRVSLQGIEDLGDRSLHGNARLPGDGTIHVSVDIEGLKAKVARPLISAIIKGQMMLEENPIGLPPGIYPYGW